MKLRILLASTLLLPACYLPSAQPWGGIHASARASVFEVGGDFSSAATSVASGGSVAFDGAIEMESDTSSSYVLGARVGLAPFEIAVSQFGYDGSHSGQVTGGTVFDGQPLGGPTDYGITSDIEMAATQVTLGLDFLNNSLGRIGMVLGLDYLDFDTMSWTLAENVNGVPAGTRQDVLADEQVPLPIIGLRGDLALPFDMSIGGTLAGGAMTYDDIEYSMLDVDVSFAWEPGYHIMVLVGYRHIETDVEGEIDQLTVDAELGFAGPYVGLEVYF